MASTQTQVWDAREAAAMQDILRQTENKGSIKYRFEDPFFAHWIQLFIN